MPQDEKPPRDRKAPAAESPDAAPGLASVIAPGSQPQAAAAAGASKAAADARVEKTPALMTARDRADAAMQRAQAHLAAGRRAEGVESLESALAHDRDHGQARQLLIRAYLEQKRGNEAMAALEAGIALQPQRIAWAMSLARLQVDVGDLASAQKTLAHSFPFAAGSADYAGFFGHVQHRLGQHGQAVDLLQAAIRLAPGEGRWWLGLAAVLEDTGRQEEAKTAYRRALATGSLSAELVALAERQAR